MNDYEKALLKFLKPMVNNARLELIEKTLSLRTNYITILLEDIFQAQNASAVLRTCDCFGIQDIHIVENKNKFKFNPDVDRGAAQWLTIHKYNSGKNNTVLAINKLKREGYRIIATTPHTSDVDIQDFDIHQGKIAIMLGTEMHGLSGTALELADEFLKIPMMGFTESLNISVSAGIIIQNLNSQLRKSSINWKLQNSEMETIRLNWVRNSIRKSRLIENGFKKAYNN